MKLILLNSLLILVRVLRYLPSSQQSLRLV